MSRVSATAQTMQIARSKLSGTPPSHSAPSDTTWLRGVALHRRNQYYQGIPLPPVLYLTSESLNNFRSLQDTTQPR
jgi:hypothetical protein